MDLQKAIEKRASIRKYALKEVKKEDIIKAIEAANMAPAPGNLQPLRYVIVEKPELKETIAEASRQEFIKDAQFVVVICSNPKDIKRFYDVRADKYLSQHAGAAAENFLLKITDLGLASCWVGAFVDNMIKRVLKIPEDINIEVILPVGYQAVTDKTKQKRKISLNRKIFFDGWLNKYGHPFEAVRRGDV